MKQFTHIILFGLLLISRTLLATDLTDYRMIEYNSTSGLPDELVKGIAQDSAGYIWLATDNGLFYFNGYDYVDTEVPNGFSNIFKSVISDSNYGTIACSDDAIYRVEFIENRAVLKPLIANNFNPIQYPKLIFLGENSEIWVSGINELLRFNCTTEQYKIFTFDEDNLSRSYSRSYQIIQFPDHNIYAISETGNIYSYDKQNDSFNYLPFEIPAENIYTTLVINSSSALLGTNEGLFEIELNSGSEVPHLHFISNEITPSVLYRYDEKHVISGSWSNGLYQITIDPEKSYKIGVWQGTENKNINAIHIDPTRMIWVATDNGILLLSSDFFKQVASDKELILPIFLAQDKRGSIFTASNEMLFRFNPKTPQKQDLIFQSIGDEITALCSYGASIWLGFRSGKLLAINSDSYEQRWYSGTGELSEITQLVESNGLIWGTIDKAENNLFVLDPTKKEREVFAIGQVTGVLADSGEIYITTTDSILQWNPANERFSALYPIQTIDATLDINQILKDPNGGFILATRNGLLSVADTIYPIEYGSYYTEEVKSALYDSSGILWLTTCRGVTRLASDYQTHFDDKDGLCNKISYVRSILLDKDDHVWVGTVSGLSFTTNIAPPLVTPKPQIEAVTGPRNTENFYKKASFPSDLYATFTLFSPIFPANSNTYYYSLMQDEDIEEKVSMIDGNDLILSNLDSGEYTLSIWVIHQGNYRLSPVLEYHFSVYTVWYQRISTWIFVIICIIAIVVLYSIMYSYKVKVENKSLEALVAKRTEEIKLRNHELRLANQSKDRFFSILAHDLRSPFHVLINSSHFIIDEWEDLTEKELRELIVGIRHTSDRTYTLLENLLQWSSSESGSLKIKSKDFNIQDNIEFTLQMIREAASAKRITMYCDVQSAFVHADVAMVDTILRNLIGNAIKFTRTDGEINITTSSTDEDFVKISVTDNGMGIPTERLSHLFDLSLNESTYGTENEKGSGLGLILCKEFVEKLGGSIHVESTPDVGSTFSFILPAAKE